MIEIKNFTKRYSGNTVYENFNLCVQEGGVTCILGESGSGKTTLLNAVAGLIKYEGSISKVKCSYIFQTPRLVPNLTVYGNLKLVCPDDGAIMDMLVKVRLEDKVNSYPRELSGGQAQRVSIARAFLYKSDVILMDEPFSSLDLKLKGEIIRLFSEIRKQDDRTVLFVTHDADEAACLAERVIIINGGKAVFDRSYSPEPVRTGAEADEIRKQLISELLK